MKKNTSIFKNPIWNAIAIVVTISAGMSQLYNWYFSGKKPYYITKNSTFHISDRDNRSNNKLELNYVKCTNEIENICKKKQTNILTETTILLWNGGTSKIDKQDIDDNPIKITTKENTATEILDIDLIHIENEKSNFKINPETKEISFSFLEHKQGALIKVFHTGYGDEDLIIDGYIENSKFNGEWEKINSLTTIFDRPVRNILLILALFSLMFPSILIYRNRKLIIKYLNNDDKGKSFFIYYFIHNSIILVISVIVPVIILGYFSKQNTFFLKGVPKQAYQFFKQQ